MPEFHLRDFLIALAASAGTGIVGFLLWLLNFRKFKAEIKRIELESHKLEAEADDITSTRLFRELDRLAQINDDLAQLAEQQKTELSTLRVQIIEYAEREATHAAENAALRKRISELENASPISAALHIAFPVEIPHESNEFDAGSTGKDEQA